MIAFTNTVGMGIKRLCLISSVDPLFFLTAFAIGTVSKAAIRVANDPNTISIHDPPNIFVIRHPTNTPQTPAGVK